MLARAGRIMEPWFAALARPTAAVPSAAAHNNALAWRTSRAGAVCERASPSSSARCPRRHLQSPSRSHHPTHTTTDHYLSDTPLGSIELGQSLGTGTHWDARRRWLDPLVGPTMCELMHGRQGGNDVAPSLGLVRPARVISVGVRSSEDWSDAQTAMLAQGNPLHREERAGEGTTHVHLPLGSAKSPPVRVTSRASRTGRSARPIAPGAVGATTRWRRSSASGSRCYAPRSATRTSSSATSTSDRASSSCSGSSTPSAAPRCRPGSWPSRRKPGGSGRRLPVARRRRSSQGATGFGNWARDRGPPGSTSARRRDRGGAGAAPGRARRGGRCGGHPRSRGRTCDAR